ncbi:hypothetical protein OR1_01656 [Geobacter sp. OR-1]|uniref:hypothetical protein n=1 Tax=Geobacter sp. OR-1 TaxID=1266765 RepID=UPI00054454E6|nr:hypothetical protein [Geobacter sp. OR-1]GAM09378.1 hypothetical protein OR1_01656 [Geobacter sp. OR-1]
MRVVAICLLVLLLNSLAIAADKKGAVPPKGKEKVAEAPKPLPTAVMTQGDFARELVKVFGWEDGVTKEAKDRDYLQILDGRRTFKFEAEKVYNARTDDVVPRKNDYFGPFSGETWLGGISVPAKVHIKVFIPIAGNYTLSAAARGNGQVWTIGEKKYQANSGDTLALTKIADISLQPGELELEMLMPPEGGLDYIVFSAPDFAPIEPMDGWRFSETLTNAAIAYVASSLLGLEGALPADEKIKPLSIVISEMPGLPKTLTLSDIRYYGKFSGKYWASTGSKSADLDIPFSLTQSGIYDLKLRCMGKPVTGTIDGNPVNINSRSSMDWVELGLHRLSEGKHNLRVRIPAFGGIDAFEVAAKKSSPEAYMSLVGMPGDPKAVVTYAEMEKLLGILKKKFSTRK